MPKAPTLWHRSEGRHLRGRTENSEILMPGGWPEARAEVSRAHYDVPEGRLESETTQAVSAYLRCKTRAKIMGEVVPPFLDQQSDLLCKRKNQRSIYRCEGAKEVST